jgi:hypothetical protein
MRKNILFVLIVSFIGLSSQIYGQNFISLFNGKDLTNWKLDKPGSFEVVGGEMITRSSGPGTDIFSEKMYGNFILQLEFLLSEVGNSGVFIWRDRAMTSIAPVHCTDMWLSQTDRMKQLAAGIKWK